MDTKVKMACQQVILIDHMIECFHACHTITILPVAPNVRQMQEDELVRNATAMLKDIPFTINALPIHKRDLARDLLRGSNFQQHKSLIREYNNWKQKKNSNVVQLRTVK